jgi:hypothetical protein
MKRLWTQLAAVVFAFAVTPRCDAAQGALKIDNDPESYFEAPNHPALVKDIGSTLTVECWVNPATDEDPAENHAGSYIIVNKEHAYELARRTEGKFMCALWPAEGTWDWNDSEVALPMNTWSHIAATWDGLIVRMFVNGKFVKSDDRWTGPDGTKGVLNDEDFPLQVGHRPDSPAQVFHGLIDEVRISKVLRYTEAGYTVPAAAFAPDSDTVALFHFDEVSGNVVKDASPIGNHGKLIGGNATIVAVTNGPFKDTP